MNENNVAATAAKQMPITVHLCQGQCLKPTTIATIFGSQWYPGSGSNSNSGPAPQFRPINQSMRRPESQT